MCTYHKNTMRWIGKIAKIEACKVMNLTWIVG